MHRSPLPGAPRPSGRAYTEGLARYSTFFLLLELLALGALAFYRIRASALLPGIAPDLARLEGYGGYLAAAVATDVLAAALVMTVLAAGWLLAPLAGTASAVGSLLLVFAYSAFMVFAADFLRIYQTAFRRGYVGSEHFTGISSILASASAELSAVSKTTLTAAVILFAAASLLLLPMAARVRFRRAFSAKRISSAAAFLRPAFAPARHVRLTVRPPYARG
jgi:hypothetical protein